MSLENFPEGTFRRRTLPPAEAAALINASKVAGRVWFATADDLGTPYRKRQKTGELVTILAVAFGINISIRDFFSPVGADGLAFPIPLNAIAITPDRPLLVVTCNYTMDKKKRDGLKDFGFRIAADTVSFRLFESLKSEA